MEKLTLSEIKAAELEILTKFDDFCKENNLRYSLACGTLLGAVRHKGFIPWDDDVDVCMPRPDYEKLVELYAEDRGIEGVDITSDRGKHAEYPFVKLTDPKIPAEIEGSDQVSNLWIDVFPVDGLPEGINKVKKIYKKSKFYQKVIVFSKWKNLKVYRGHHNKIAALLIKIFVSLYGAKRAIRKSTKLAEKYGITETGFVGSIAWGCYGVGERMSADEYLNFVKVEFEGREFSAPSCWDSYLHGIYGNYMELPPENKRSTHYVTAYRVDKTK